MTADLYWHPIGGGKPVACSSHANGLKPCKVCDPLGAIATCPACNDTRVVVIGQYEDGNGIVMDIEKQCGRCIDGERGE